jgi:hypothetical protein
MSETLSERRMAENDVVFRQLNEKIQAGFDEIKRLAKEDGQETMFEHDDTPLNFYCECSDENCRKRVLLKPSLYSKIHQHKNRFVLICGHETKSIEKIISKEPSFCIVEKFINLPESADNLNKTPVNNT